MLKEKLKKRYLSGRVDPFDDFPQFASLVPRRGNDRASIFGDADCQNIICVPFQLMVTNSSIAIPNLDCVVVRARNDCHAVARDCDRPNAAGM